MKPFYYIVLMLLTCLFAQEVLSQTQTPQRRQTPRQRTEAESNDLPALSVRAAAKNEDQFKNLDNMVWIREIYREIDLRQETNSALYFPEYAIGDRMNLFSLIFKLMAQGNVTGYRYMDGREIFTSDYKVPFNDILANLGVEYTTQGTGDQTRYLFDNRDIPNNEALIYMVKEAYYFDQANGMFNSKVLAICPILVRGDDGGDRVSYDDEDSEEGDDSEYNVSETSTRTALFWILYEDIRPYISKAYIMTSNLNNALTYTIDDFFNKNMYEGGIVKTTNMMNRSLAQEAGGDPKKLKLAQDSIENQLKFFEEKLWVPEDTTTVVDKKGKKVAKKADNKKDEKPKEVKVETGPTKSVRRTR